MTEQENEEIDRLAESSSSEPIWRPNPDHEDGRPNPQRLALESEADELFYGGAAGGGKTDLIIGAAFTEHKKSVLFRRTYTNLRGLIDRSIDLVGSSDDYNKQDKVWRRDNRVIELGAMKDEDDKKNWQGRAHDLKAYDEITEFTRTQYLFTIGWNRTTEEGQRCRVIVTGNPPIDESGAWVIDEWGPWLIPDHPNKAEPGELRWYYYDDDNIIWLDSGEPVEINGKKQKPRSRTFIPAKLDDNPHLKDTGYEAVLNSLPEELRDKFRDGDFNSSKKTDPFQVIPTAWVKQAQNRWMEMEKPDMPCSGVGVDVARGGQDKLTISKRYGVWFDKIIKIPGAEVEDGPKAAGIVFNALENENEIGYINVDIIGVGTSAYDSLKVMFPGKTVGVNAAKKSEYEVKKERKIVLKMGNIRAEYHWKMREALDPEHGDDIALPPGNEIIADLCAAKWVPLAGGIVQIEKKDDIKKRIGRSPDVGEAIMLSNFNVLKKKKFLSL